MGPVIMQLMRRLLRLKEKVAEKNPDRVESFTKGMQKFIMEALKSFDKWRFYLGENMDFEAMMVLQGYRDDNITPYFIFFKDGLEEEKF